MNETLPETSGETDVAPEAHRTRYQNVQASVDRYLRFVDISAAILLAVATVATAWCAYQATRWSGVQATSFAEASSLRLQAGTTFNLALAQINYDTDTFIEWINARAADDQELFEYVTENLISDEFKPFLDAWVAAEAEESPDGDTLPSPFDDDAYIEKLLEPTVTLLAQAEVKFTEATDANQTGDDYVLATVLFASVLFFAGISSKFERLRIQGALSAMALLMFLLGIVQFIRLPIH